MLPKELTKDLLKSIELSGVADEASASEKHLINSNLHNVIDISSGKIRLRKSVAEKFNLIVGRPEGLKALSPAEIRCLYCRRVISYPGWYYKIEYAVNVFHYFVCFDGQSPDKPKFNCKRG